MKIKTHKNCKHCGKEFQIYRTTDKFCSWGCSNASGGTKAPKKIGKRTRDRLKEFGSESVMYKRIWENRPHYCEICGNHILEPKTFCFSHRLSKKMYKEFRYFDLNILLCCSIDCHGENDKRNAGNHQFIINELLGTGK